MTIAELPSLFLIAELPSLLSIAELPSLLPIADVVEALLHVQDSLSMIVKMIINSPWSVTEGKVSLHAI